MYVGIEVGKPFPGTAFIQPDSVVFEFSDSGGFLRMAWQDPNTSEMQQFTKGEISLGLVELDGIIFFLVKFGTLAWMDAPYHVNFSKEYDLMDLSDPFLGYAIQVVLLNSRDRRVKMIKLLGMPHELSKYFNELVTKQRNESTENYDVRLQRIYQKYTTDDLAKMGKVEKLELKR